MVSQQSERKCVPKAVLPFDWNLFQKGPSANFETLSVQVKAMQSPWKFFHVVFIYPNERVGNFVQLLIRLFELGAIVSCRHFIPMILSDVALDIFSRGLAVPYLGLDLGSPGKIQRIRHLTRVIRCSIAPAVRVKLKPRYQPVLMSGHCELPFPHGFQAGIGGKMRLPRK